MTAPNPQSAGGIATPIVAPPASLVKTDAPPSNDDAARRAADADAAAEEALAEQARAADAAAEAEAQRAADAAKQKEPKASKPGEKARQYQAEADAIRRAEAAAAEAAAATRRPEVWFAARGAAVTELQDRLARIGLIDPEPDDPDLPVDEPGVFGPVTEAAVRGFQQSVGLDPSARCDAATWAALIARTK